MCSDARGTRQRWSMAARAASAPAVAPKWMPSLSVNHTRRDLRSQLQLDLVSFNSALLGLSKAARWLQAVLLEATSAAEGHALHSATQQAGAGALLAPGRSCLAPERCVAPGHSECSRAARCVPVSARCGALAGTTVALKTGERWQGSLLRRPQHTRSGGAAMSGDERLREGLSRAGLGSCASAEAPSRMPSPAVQRSPPLAAAEAWEKSQNDRFHSQSLAFAIPQRRGSKR